MGVPTYAAHIITHEAVALGEPEVVVMTQADETGASDMVASYPLPSDDSEALLRTAGWRPIGVPVDVEPGYSIVDVEVDRWPVVLKDAAVARDSAMAESTRQETAFRTLVRDAMLDESTNKTAVADLAGISRERAYQIRDRRR